MKLTPYDKSDAVKIKQLFTEVFSDSEGESEGVLIGNMVVDLINTTEPEDIFGFVASEQGQIIGSIFFTRLSFDTPVEAFILSPVAIRTNQQGKGVGQHLINYGIEQMRQMGVKLLFTYGDPNFYAKVGFRSIPEDVAKAPLELTQPEGWLCHSLDAGEIAPIPGKSTCVSALNKPEYW